MIVLLSKENCPTSRKYKSWFDPKCRSCRNKSNNVLCNGPLNHRNNLQQQQPISQDSKHCDEVGSHEQGIDESDKTALSEMDNSAHGKILSTMASDILWNDTREDVESRRSNASNVSCSQTTQVFMEENTATCGSSMLSNVKQAFNTLDEAVLSLSSTTTTGPKKSELLLSSQSPLQESNPLCNRHHHANYEHETFPEPTIQCLEQSDSGLSPIHVSIFVSKMHKDSSELSSRSVVLKDEVTDRSTRISVLLQALKNERARNLARIHSLQEERRKMNSVLINAEFGTSEKNDTSSFCSNLYHPGYHVKKLRSPHTSIGSSISDATSFLEVDRTLERRRIDTPTHRQSSVEEKCNVSGMHDEKSHCSVFTPTTLSSPNLSKKNGDTYQKIDLKKPWRGEHNYEHIRQCYQRTQQYRAADTHVRLSFPHLPSPPSSPLTPSPTRRRSTNGIFPRNLFNGGSKSVGNSKSATSMFTDKSFKHSLFSDDFTDPYGGDDVTTICDGTWHDPIMSPMRHSIWKSKKIAELSSSLQSAHLTIQRLSSELEKLSSTKKRHHLPIHGTSSMSSCDGNDTIGLMTIERKSPLSVLDLSSVTKLEQQNKMASHCAQAMKLDGTFENFQRVEAAGTDWKTFEDHHVPSSSDKDGVTRIEAGNTFGNKFIEIAPEDNELLTQLMQLCRNEPNLTLVVELKPSTSTDSFMIQCARVQSTQE